MRGRKSARRGVCAWWCGDAGTYAGQTRHTHPVRRRCGNVCRPDAAYPPCAEAMRERMPARRGIPTLCGGDMGTYAGQTRRAPGAVARQSSGRRPDHPPYRGRDSCRAALRAAPVSRVGRLGERAALVVVARFGLGPQGLALWTGCLTRGEDQCLHRHLLSLFARGSRVGG